MVWTDHYIIVIISPKVFPCTKGSMNPSSRFQKVSTYVWLPLKNFMHLKQAQLSRLIGSLQVRTVWLQQLQRVSSRLAKDMARSVKPRWKGLEASDRKRLIFHKINIVVLLFNVFLLMSQSYNTEIINNMFSAKKQDVWIVLHIYIHSK